MKKTILVIDDDKTIRFLLQNILNEFDVTLKEEGLFALTWLNEGNIPDLIIMDMEMPNLSGSELIKRIKFSSKLRNVPIIVMSGNENVKVKQEFMKMGAVDYIIKPFTGLDFVTRVKKVINAIPTAN